MSPRMRSELSDLCGKIGGKVGHGLATILEAACEYEEKLQTENVHLGQQILHVTHERDEAYLDRNLLLALVCRLVLHAMREDWWARIERDPAEPDNSVWRYYVLVQIGDTQLTYHVHEEDRRTIFVFLDEGPRDWDGHTTEEKRERLRKLVERRKL